VSEQEQPSKAMVDIEVMAAMAAFVEDRIGELGARRPVDQVLVDLALNLRTELSAATTQGTLFRLAKNWWSHPDFDPNWKPGKPWKPPKAWRRRLPRAQYRG